MARAGIDQLLYLMEEAFEGTRHSLLDNLQSLCDGHWECRPVGAGRSVFDIVRHVGECKYVYDNHAFADRSMRWDRPATIPAIGSGSPPAIIDWLREGQRRLRTSVDALQDDGELLQPRWANWDRQYETRWLINVMVQHDLYHAGEINHLRALSQGNDRWAYDA